MQYIFIENSFLNLALNCANKCLEVAAFSEKEGLKKCANLCKKCAEICLEINSSTDNLTASKMEKYIDTCNTCAIECYAYYKQYCLECANLCSELANQCKRQHLKLQMFQENPKPIYI